MFFWLDDTHDQKPMSWHSTTGWATPDKWCHEITKQKVTGSKQMFPWMNLQICISSRYLKVKRWLSCIRFVDQLISNGSILINSCKQPTVDYHFGKTCQAEMKQGSYSEANYDEFNAFVPRFYRHRGWWLKPATPESLAVATAFLRRKLHFFCKPSSQIRWTSAHHFSQMWLWVIPLNKLFPSNLWRQEDWDFEGTSAASSIDLLPPELFPRLRLQVGPCFFPKACIMFMSSIFRDPQIRLWHTCSKMRSIQLYNLNPRCDTRYVVTPLLIYCTQTCFVSERYLFGFSGLYRLVFQSDMKSTWNHWPRLLNLSRALDHCSISFL